MNANDASTSTIVLDLKAGKVPVVFHEDTSGLFGEMNQTPPVFGRVHDRSTMADVLGLDPAEIEADVPVQTVSTDLPFAIVSIRRLSTLQSLHLNFQKISACLNRQPDPTSGFYYISRDTGDPKVLLRAPGPRSARGRSCDRFGRRMHVALDGQVRRACRDECWRPLLRMEEPEIVLHNGNI
ncbi:MAG: hypothetical protein ACR2JB_28595 [Bryobacteraceae bacterium]